MQKKLLFIRNSNSLNLSIRDEGPPPTSMNFLSSWSTVCSSNDKNFIGGESGNDFNDLFEEVS